MISKLGNLKDSINYKSISPFTIGFSLQLKQDCECLLVFLLHKTFSNYLKVQWNWKSYETVLIYIFVYLSVFVSRFCGTGNGTHMAGFGIKLRKTPDNGASEKEKRNIEEQLGAKSKKHQRKGKMDGPLDATFHRDVSSHSHSLFLSLTLFHIPIKVQKVRFWAPLFQPLFLIESHMYSTILAFWIVVLLLKWIQQLNFSNCFLLTPKTYYH